MSLLLLLTAVAQAATPAPLRWEDVRQLALERSPALGSAARTEAASVSARKGAVGGFLPKVTLSGDRTRSETELRNLVTKKTDLSYAATASLNLFNGFATVANLQRARASEAEAGANRDLTSANLRHDLRVAYFQIHVAQERVRLNERIVKREEQNQKLIELKYNSGSEARWNVLTTKADLARAQVSLANARSQLANAREQLARLLNLDALPADAVAPPSEEVFRPLSVDPETAAREHPERRRALFAAERSGRDVTVARSAFLPTFDLAYSRTVNKTRPEGGTTTRTDVKALQLSASWSVFNGLTDYYRVQEANLTREAAELSQVEAERRLRAAAAQQGRAFEQALASLPVARAIREAAEERVRTVSAQYRAGLKTFIDWEQAESQLLDAEDKEVKALDSALNAFAELELALGRTLEQP